MLHFVFSFQFSARFDATHFNIFTYGSAALLYVQVAVKDNVERESLSERVNVHEVFLLSKHRFQTGQRAVPINKLGSWRKGYGRNGWVSRRRFLKNSKNDMVIFAFLFFVNRNFNLRVQTFSCYRFHDADHNIA